ncbi:hypothetical protein [Promicromonospora sp. NPDC057488]|uniref:hypothetical protein n=1 Tax=Promicromonospora sp. NPDC057488 TaxID=3346147 RepID=UPI00366BF3F6
MTTARAENCDFCEIERESLGGDGRDLSERQLHRDAATGLGVYADIAPVKPGHLLLLAPGHDLTMATALAGDGERWRYVDAVREAYRRTFPDNGLTILEHGSGGTGHRRDCIEHAHWHLLPFEHELGEIVDADLRAALNEDQAQKECLSDIRALDSRYGKSNYLLYLDHGKNPDPTSGPARAYLYTLKVSLPYQQYTRSVGYRYVATTTGTQVGALDWDWALHASSRLVEQTMQMRTQFARHVDSALLRPVNDRLHDLVVA